MNLLELFSKIKSGNTLESVLRSHGFEQISENAHIFSIKPFTIHSELHFEVLSEYQSEMEVDGVVHHYFFEMALLTDVLHEATKPAHIGKSEKQLAEILLIFADVE